MLRPHTTSFEPIRAFTALSRLMKDPEDTTSVFRVIDAFSGKNGDRVLERVRSHSVGAKLLQEQPDILPLLSDRDWLNSQPESSLARAYLQFMDAMGITPGGLVHAALDQREAPSREHEWVRSRLRDTHDLWHTVTGYHGDVLGEISLLAFTAAQTHNPGVGLIVLTALRRGDAGQRRVVIDGFKRGLVASWLPVVRWEEMLPLPISEVRRQLRLDDPPEYEHVLPGDIGEDGLMH